jgi:hypothetical protein
MRDLVAAALSEQPLGNSLQQDALIDMRDLMFCGAVAVAVGNSLNRSSRADAG